MSNDVPL